MANNLPQAQSSKVDAKQFFDNFFVHEVTFPANEIAAIILLNQSRVDDVNVFVLLDSLKGLTDIQLGQVVAQVLNSYREKTSILGYHISTIADTYESRNILV
jgi:hypothetical protein